MYQTAIYSAAKFFYNTRVKGSTRLMKVFFNLIPLKKIALRHPLGFQWKLDSREALWTYLSSCESFTTKVVIEVAGRVKTSICVGANRGWYPLILRKFNTDCEIYAFEPNTKTYELLMDNLMLNAASIHSYKFALGRSTSIRNIYSYENANDGMSTLYPTDAISNSFAILETIEVKTLDEVFLNNCQLPEPILLQMDIEGAEHEALLGSAQFLKKYSPIVICEINPLLLESAGNTSFELFHHMETLGYVIYWIDERGKLWLQKGDESCRHLESLPVGSGSNYIFLKDSPLKSKLLSNFVVNY